MVIEVNNNMIHLLPVPVMLDPGLTQAAVRRLAQLNKYRNGRSEWVISEENQLEHQHVTANLFSHCGLCDPGDLNHHCL
jgi:hypothetical protein